VDKRRRFNTRYELGAGRPARGRDAVGVVGPLRTMAVLQAMREWTGSIILVGLAFASANDAGAADQATAYFRIFLTDNSTLASYGDFTRVGDRVVFSLPLDELGDQPKLHLASVPADRVDWDTTERYRKATRAAQYAASRGEADFALLSTEVAALLNEITLTPDPQRRVALAREARARLAVWPAEHYGHRADDIRQIVLLVDDVISDLRIALGESTFDIDLVSGVAAPATVAPLPKPTLQESILQALWAAELAASPPERRSLLDAALAAIDGNSGRLPPAWVLTTRARAARAIAGEEDLDRRVAALRTRALASVERLARHTDVKGMERLLLAVRKDAAPLASVRAEEVQALVVSLEARLAAVQQYRLELDRWTLRADALRASHRALDRHLRELARGQPALDDIRAQAGPPADTLGRLSGRLARTARELAGLRVPADGRDAYAVLKNAVQLAANAVRLRQAAVISGDIQHARDASAAAEGALTLLARAQHDITELVQPPRRP
jgi:hypothetical protein